MFMQEVSNPLDQIADGIQSTGAFCAPEQPEKKKLPSKSARSKKNISHTKHLNKKTLENKLKPKLDAKRYFPEEDLQLVLEECRRTVLQQPVREVEIKVNTPSLTKVCKETIDYLYNVGKVQPSEFGGHERDTVNLEKIVMAQAVAKVHAARRHNGKLVDTHEVEYINRIEKRFTVIPKVLNVYLEQIGQFEIEGQKFVPKSLPSLAFSRLAVGRFLTTMARNGPSGVRMVGVATVQPAHLNSYVDGGIFTGDPLVMLMSNHGTVEWVQADSIEDFRQLCEWYESFITRCTRKAGSLLQTVVYGKGEGTAAQLVGSRDDDRISQREMWCCKRIDQNTMQIGGLFGYGLMSTDKFHDEDIACIVDRMDIEGMYQRIQRCQKL